jgi:hypothetical protein
MSGYHKAAACLGSLAFALAACGETPATRNRPPSVSRPGEAAAGAGRNRVQPAPAAEPVRPASRFDARIVFAGDGLGEFDCWRNQNFLPPCRDRTLRRLGASETAIAFSRLFDDDVEYASAFREFGRVDLVHTRLPMRESGRTYIVNGSPEIVPAIHELSAADRRNPALRRMIGSNPDAWLQTEYSAFVRHQPTSGGGQRFIFSAPFMNCRACEPLLMIEYAVEFSGDGRFLGSRLHRILPPG